jgi:hypothetical protein
VGHPEFWSKKYVDIENIEVMDDAPHLFPKAKGAACGCALRVPLNFLYSFSLSSRAEIKCICKSLNPRDL